MTDHKTRERDAAKRALGQALQALNNARLAVGVWADAVSQEAEKRLGVAPGDPRRYDDAEYAAALDVVGKVAQVHQDVEQTMTFVDWTPDADAACQHECHRLYTVTVTYRGGMTNVFKDVGRERARDLEQKFDTNPDVLIVRVS